MPTRPSAVKPSLTTHNNKRKLILTLETLSKRIMRAVNPIVIIGSETTYSAHRIKSTVKGIRRRAGTPLPTYQSKTLEKLPKEYRQKLLEETDLIIAFEVKDTEHKAACLLLDAKNSGAYTIGVGPLPRLDYTKVNFYIKSAQLPGPLNFLIIQMKKLSK